MVPTVRERAALINARKSAMNVQVSAVGLGTLHDAGQSEGSSCASFVPSMMTTMSHLPEVSALQSGRSGGGKNEEEGVGTCRTGGRHELHRGQEARACKKLGPSPCTADAAKRASRRL